MTKRRHDGDEPKKLCGAKKTKGEGTCRNLAGHRTPHPGTGRCWLHGGNTRNHIAKAETEQAVERMRTYGAPIDTDPLTALLDEIKRTAGHVSWLGEHIG